MTLAEVITEIETGPLSRACAPHWANVFEAPVVAKPDPTKEVLAVDKARVQAQIGSWETKVRRAGRIHPDAAYAIWQILTPRAVELGWTGFTAKTIKYAKIETLGK